MKIFLLHWFVNTVALVVAAALLPGISVDNWFAALLAALLLALLNAFLRPLLLFITLPINILSLGAFTLFINAFLFYLAARLTAGFAVSGFWSAFLGALLFSIVSFLLNLFAGTVAAGSVRRPPPCRERPDGAVDVEAYPTGDRRREAGRPGDRKKP